MHNLFERGKENGAKDIKLLSKHEMKAIEPNCEVKKGSLFVYLCLFVDSCLFVHSCLFVRLFFNFQGVLAIHSPHTGIVDWGVVARSYGKEFQSSGGEIILNFEVLPSKIQIPPPRLALQTLKRQ